MVNFIDKNKKILAVGIICIILAILFAVSNMPAEEEKSTSGVYQEFEKQTDNKELKSLLKKYYESYAAGDVKALKKVAYPISDREKSYINLISQYVKSYDIEEIYSKPGNEEDDLLLSVEVGIHYKKLKTVAPGLDFFYVRKNDKDKYYIDNLYSTFNTQNGDLDVDPTINSMIAAYEQQSDVVDLQTDVSQRFNEITLKNKDFNVYFTKTLPEAVTDWAADYKKKEKKESAKKKKDKQTETAKADKKDKSDSEDADEEDEADSKDKEDEKESKDDASKEKEDTKEEDSKEDTKKADTKKESSQKAEKSQKSEPETVYATSNINVRTKPSTSARVIAQAEAGTKLLRYAKKNGWSKIRYNGEKRWVKSEFLTSKNPADEKSESSKKKSTDSSKKTSKTKDTDSSKKKSKTETSKKSSESGETTKKSTEKTKQSTDESSSKKKSEKQSTKKSSSTKKKKSGVSDGQVVKMSTAVNIRSKRSTDSRILAAVHDGDLVRVVKSFDDGWTKVRFEGKVGFMRTEFLTGQ